MADLEEDKEEQEISIDTQDTSSKQVEEGKGKDEVLIKVEPVSEEGDGTSSTGTEGPSQATSVATTEVSSPSEAPVDTSTQSNTPTHPPLVESPLPPPPVPDADNLPVIQLKPRRPRPPKKGILKPPSTAAAHSARFSFKRDILQPLQYSRLAGGVVPVSSGLPSSVAVGEAMGNAAATAGGWMGNALKRLGQAAGVSAEAQAQIGGHAKPLVPTPSAQPSNEPSTTSDSTSSQPSPASPPSASAQSAVASTSTSAPVPPSHPLQPSLSVQSLKQVRFRMQSLAVVYPINGASSSSFSPSPASSTSSRPVPPKHTTFFNDLKIGFHPGPPLAPAEEAETRKRVDREWRSRIKMRSRTSGEKDGVANEKGKSRTKGEESKGWTGAELERLYRECCRTREEPGIERVKRLLRVCSYFLPLLIEYSQRQF